MSRLLKPLMLLAVLTFLPAFGSGERLFAPSADLWDRWSKHDAGSTRQIDHSAWDQLLKTYVQQGSDGVNRVDYRGFAANGRSALQAYLSAMSEAPVDTLGRAEQMAYWINLYNALTVQVILDNYPVESIRDVNTSPGLFSSGPWGQEVIEIGGTGLTLNDIEHRILRPIWNDPRIHYAVNCASIGCPDLSTSAYRGVDIEKALDRAARDYVNDPRGVSVRDGKVTVSRIYDWFIEDFGGTEQSVLAHLSRYAEPGLAEQLRAAGGLEDTQYDWSLNDAKR